LYNPPPQHRLGWGKERYDQSKESTQSKAKGKNKQEKGKKKLAEKEDKENLAAKGYMIE
jgi:hypothetical protein